MVERGFPPGTTGEPSRYAGEEQGEPGDSEIGDGVRKGKGYFCVLSSDPRGTSRIEESNDATLGERVSFKRGRPSSESKGKSKVETEYRDAGIGNERILGLRGYGKEGSGKLQDAHNTRLPAACGRARAPMCIPRYLS